MSFPWQTQDPFLFCVHHRDMYPEGNEEMGPRTSLAGRNIGNDFTIKDGWRMYHGSKMPGFPYHPHRGFETITISKEGIVDHTDSLGAAGRFGAGDVQWMTAGKGVQHSEMFPLIHSDRPNTLEIFQIWLNLPKAKKFVEPHFKMLWADAIPMVKAAGGKVEINLVAGHLEGEVAPPPTPESWANTPDNEVMVLTMKMEANASWTLPPAAQKVNRTVYFYRGSSIKIAGLEIPLNSAVEVEAHSSLDIENGDETCYLLVLQGKPINEPVVQYGPFVMNSEAEIREAYSDYQRTQFGGWPWPMQEQAHERHRGRFAQHADGTLEERPI